MLVRLLYLFLLLYLVFALLNLILFRLKRTRRAGSAERMSNAEAMVLDPQCQSYLPKGDAIFRGGHYFCGEECARVYLSRQDKKDEDGDTKDATGKIGSA